ncbi:MAG: methylenetetrahydrofolate reductase [Desulfovibrionaceae bacterium]
MRIPDLIRPDQRFISMEFFPPKEREAWPGFFEVAGRLASLNPLFVSVTYGAGGGTQANTLEIVRRLKADVGLEPLAHLTCVGADSARIDAFLTDLRAAGCDNVLALRGDPPRDRPDFDFSQGEFHHGSDLAAHIRTVQPDMGVGVTGYPEAHPESPSIASELKWSKHKIEAGGQFMVTQLFFDNRLYFDYVERLRGMGVNVPIIPGLLPIMSLKNVKFIISLCGAAIPGKFLAALEKAHETGGDPAVYALGMDYAKRQAQALLDGGAPGVHLYTLNRAEACLEIGASLSL